LRMKILHTQWFGVNFLQNRILTKTFLEKDKRCVLRNKSQTTIHEVIKKVMVV
jgi:hypothetical protein